MIGIGALGERALGELPSSTTSVSVLSVSSGSFTLVRQAVTFPVRQPWNVTSFTLSGFAASFQLSLPAAASSFALTGNAATFRTALAAQAGLFSLAGIAVAFDPNEFAQTGRLALTSTGAFLSYDIDLGGIGGRIAGGQFTRGKWRELKEQERARAEGIAAARAAEERRVREEAVTTATKRKAALEAQRAAEDKANAQRARRQTLIDALAAASGAQSLGGVAPVIAVADARRLQEARDEEEAVVRLLLLE